MSNRERWIIYPLLFLSLGTALKPYFGVQMNVRSVCCDQLVAKRIECANLDVVRVEDMGREGASVNIRMRSLPVQSDPAGQETKDDSEATQQGGLIEIANADHSRRLSLVAEGVLTDGNLKTPIRRIIIPWQLVPSPAEMKKRLEKKDAASQPDPAKADPPGAVPPAKVDLPVKTPG